MIERRLLVGDNPFHGVSHFSQERARARNEQILDPASAAEIVKTSIENGAEGFMFSVSETTLGIINRLSVSAPKMRYYAIVPAAGDYVRLSSQLGMIGLAKYVAKETIRSKNISAITDGAKGLALSDLKALFKAYLSYEISRISNNSGNRRKPYTLMLHELVTEMAVALDMDWLIRVHVNYLTKRGIKPGFETRNFSRLVEKLQKLGINTGNIVITAPFNALGYQMNPSKIECEESLRLVPEAEVIAMAILASGHLKLAEAENYLQGIQGIKGLVIGVSNLEQAGETFKFFKR